MENKHFKNNTNYSGINLKNVCLECKEGEDVNFRTSSFVGVTTSILNIDNFGFIKSKMVKSNLSNGRLEKCYFKNSVVVDCKLTGVICAEGRLNGTEFINSKIDLANFCLTDLNSVSFNNCVLTGADFQGTKLKNVKFIDCDLKNVNFSQAELKKIDLRGSDITGIKIEMDSFKELTINHAQAVYIASLLGMNIKS